MSYSIPAYSKNAFDKAGRSLAATKNSEEFDELAWEILGNWRASHAFPLNSITVSLKGKVSRLGLSAVVVQRLKRSRSILAKLSRESMRLTQMQDIGGCRAVVPTIEDVYRLRSKFYKSRSKHVLISEDDYIASPKSSGYRGVHLVYKFQSSAKPEYSNLLLEVQLRSHAQHAWATAVETVGAVVGQALKSSQGESMWLSYFQIASLALEYSETPAFGRSPFMSRGQVARELANLDKSLEVNKKLTAYRAALRATEQPKAKNAGYFLLVLLPDEPGLQVFSFAKDEADAAQKEYQRYERLLPFKSRQMPLFPELADYSGAQVVLVGAESFRSIREAYPNYYLDTEQFISLVNIFIRKYRHSA
ncbi:MULTISPECIES: RelA/SpoT domain-containing protein [Acidovorax]|uniref:RelA/SpoT domain-containing protein n=1 Tax=Acidovorax TaxID=12916 RepID=UPI0020917A43|nr:RelA/SpoT domain-containing protein [Acidovorax kalamii]MCO5354456.1 RelA/SpoT domain-containing protein [Acidovorax kalamii]